jgi:hypothetical protein
MKAGSKATDTFTSFNYASKQREASSTSSSSAVSIPDMRHRSISQPAQQPGSGASAYSSDVEFVAPRRTALSFVRQDTRGNMR